MPRESEPIFPIGVVAKLLDISDHTIRVYEREGLVLTSRTPSGHRRFSQDDVARLRSIRRMITDYGLNLEGIKRLCSMIPCYKINPDCLVNDYEQCEVFKRTGNPCWAQEHKSEPCRSRDCYYCPVYRTHFDCTNIKDLVYKKERQLKVDSNSVRN